METPIKVVFDAEIRPYAVHRLGVGQYALRKGQGVPLI